MNKLSNAFLRVSLFILILAVVGVERAWSVPLEFDPMAGLEQHDPSGVSAARNRTFEIGAAVRARSKPVVAALSRALPRGGVSHHLAISGSPHATVRGAIADSLTPLPIRKNVRGAFDPTSLAVDVAFPVASSVAQQAISKGRVDPRRVVDDVKPVSLAGGLAGGLAGSAAGAALQSTLAATTGPLGKVAGFVARPVMAWAGASVGGRYAARAARGDARLNAAIEETVRSIEPGRDVGAVVGGSVGTVVGQALIPVPVVGGVVGNVAGTMVGAWIGSRLTNPKADAALRNGTKLALTRALKGAFGRPGGPVSSTHSSEPQALSADEP